VSFVCYAKITAKLRSVNNELRLLAVRAHPDDEASTPQIRKQEMANAIKILGCQHRWLGFVDSGYPEGDLKPPLPDGCFAAIDPEKAAAPLVEIFREFKPHVVTTYDENGGYPHPDHIRTHEITMK